MNFEEARAEYQRLRQAYDNRAISQEEYARRVQELQVRDESGTYWAINGATGDWLRYDGTAWVPGQPPIARTATPPPMPSYSTPAPQPQAGGLEATQYATPPQTAAYGAAPAGAAAAPGAAAPARRRSAARPILIGCAALALLALLACGVIALLASRDGGFNFALGGAPSGISDVVVTTDVDSDGRPLVSVQEVALGTDVFITYTARLNKGQSVTLKLTRNGQPVQLTGGDPVYLFEQNGTCTCRFELNLQQRGDYRGELFVDSETTPRATTTFSVR